MGARRRAQVHAALVLALALAARSAAQQPQALSGPLTLRAAIERALAHNPALLAAEARRLAMAERPAQAGALPDPMLMARYHNEDWAISFGDSDFSFVEVGVEQEIPLAGKRGLRREIAVREAARESAMRDMTALMVLARVGMQHAELVALERTRAALEESQAALDGLIAQAAARYGVGQAEQQDVLRASLERDMLRERLEMVARERAAARAELAALLGYAQAGELPPSAELEPVRAPAPLAVLRARAAERSPALRAAQEELLRSGEAARLARREIVPEFELTAAYMDKQQLLPEWEVGMKVSLPLWARSKQRRMASEAALMQRAAEQESRRAALDTEARLAELHAAAESSHRLIALYRDSLVPSASLTFDSARASYGTGRVDLMTVIGAFVAVRDYRVREAEETARLLGALAEIGPLVGETPLGEALEETP